MKQNDWISAHLFYHSDPTPLLVQCIKPLVDELRAQQLISKYFFIRYWQGGPHIRLRLLPTSLRQAQAICDLITPHIRAFFLSSPSMTTVDVQHYEEVASSLSLREYGKDVHVPLYANNSLHYIAYEPEYERYGGEKAMPLVETHFMEASDIVLQLLAHGLADNRRMGQVVIMTLLALALYETRPQELIACLQGQHQDLEVGLAYISAYYQEQFAQLYQLKALKMHGIVRSVLKKGREKAFEADNTSLSLWMKSVRTLCDELQRLESAGMLERGQQLHVEVKDAQAAQPAWQTILFLCLHMQNNRFGLTLIEEAYVRSLLIQTLNTLAPTECIGI